MNTITSIIIWLVGIALWILYSFLDRFTSKQRSSADYWPYIISSFLLGGIFITLLFVVLDFPPKLQNGQNLLPNIEIYRKIICAFLSSGVFAYAQSREVKFNLNRFIYANIFLLFIALLNGVTSHNYTIVIVFFPGGIAGYPILLLCGWFGIIISRNIGYQDEVVEEIEYEKKVEDKFNTILTRTYDSFRAEHWISIIPNYIKQTQKYNTYEKYLNSILEGSEKYFLKDIIEKISFEPDEILIFFLSCEEIAMTNKKFIIYRSRSHFSTDIIIERIIPLKNVTKYEFSKDSKQILITLKSGECIKKRITWMAPGQVIAEKLIQINAI